MGKDSPKPNPEELLARQIKSMLAYWRSATETITSDTLEMLEAERQNLLRAIQVGLSFPQNWSETAEILSQSFPFTEQRGYWQEWIPLLQRSLEISEADWPPAIRILIMNRLGQAYRLDRQFAKAVAIHLEADRIAKQSGQPELIGRVHHDLLEDYLFSREYDKGKSIGLSAVSLLETAEGHERLLANSHKMLGLVLLRMGEIGAAEKHLQTAVALWRTIDDPLFLARALSDLSQVSLALKEYDVALDALYQAAALLSPTIYELDKCMIQINLGAVYAAQQQWSAAEAAFRQANSPYLRQSVNTSRKARVNSNLGYILFKQGRFEEAEEYLHLSIHFWEQIHDELQAANTRSTLADCLLAQQRIEAALPLYDHVVETLRRFPENAFASQLLVRYEPIPTQLRQQTEK